MVLDTVTIRYGIVVHIKTKLFLYLKVVKWNNKRPFIKVKNTFDVTKTRKPLFV
jgi:hypothetical protein